MRFQSGLLSLFLLGISSASFIEASSAKKGKKIKNKNKKSSHPKQGPPSTLVDSLPGDGDNPICQSFREAVQGGDAFTAIKVFHGGNNELKRHCAMYLISLGSSELVDMIYNAHALIRIGLLQVLLVYASQQLLDEIFDALEFPNNILSDVANNEELACTSQRFTYLLGKIPDKGEQEVAVENGVVILFAKNKAEYFDPLISALNEGTFLSKDLENVAIRYAFERAPLYQDDRIVHAKRFFDHPVISTKDYSGALYSSYNNGNKTKELFYWLLANADRQDLEAVKKNDMFSTWKSEFQDAVNHALQVVGSERRPGITRRRRVALMKEALIDGVPSALLDLIGEYIEW
jgi:hypothetical protein